ncbi:MAG: PrpR N-terminal domain-containing protein [Clostridia bacterium]|nr:PrpR N-terminal domain-containing protein [Clostridia bacterium]
MSVQNDTPIRILSIAPYEAMATSLMRAAEAYPGIQLEAYTGDLSAGVEIAQQLDLSQFDVIISRGGTAEMLRSVTDLPVVEIPVSLYDVLRTIKLAENYTDKTAIVGFPGVTENAHTLCNLMRFDIPIETVHHSEDVAAVLQKLRARNIHTVICDVVTHGIARSEGFQAMLITSGEGSLHHALQDAESQGSTFRRIRNENQFLRNMIGQDSRHCVVFNSKREKVFAISDILPDELLTVMRRRIPSVPMKGELLFYHHTGGIIHAVSASSFEQQGQRYFVFRDQPSQIPLRTVHSGIRSYDAPECEQLFSNSFFTVSGSMGEMEQRLSPIAESGHAVMIIGEEGTGKEQIARALYLRSRLKNHPFVTVDASRLTDRGWEFLLERNESPLSTEGTAIFFRHMDEAPEPRQNALISLIEETGLTRRLWLIFSCDTKDGETLNDFARKLSVKLGPLSLSLPTLRSRRDEIPALASLYLGNLNMELGKQVSGFESGALEMMTRYNWPGNYTQFKHVLHELTILTSGPYISSSDVAELLAQERKVYRHTPEPVSGPSPSFAGMTLDEITHRIVRQTLSENQGNQSLAARKLGISRTTLWRMLSQDTSTQKK